MCWQLETSPLQASDYNRDEHRLVLVVTSVYGKAHAQEGYDPGRASYRTMNTLSCST